MRTKVTGVVSIVGAGPGDPDLVTVKGLRVIQQADVVLHDGLVHPGLLAEARAGASVVDVGKHAGREDEQQLEIHRLMIAHAREGRSVCRLQGGDPFVFGRGGEELAALLEARIPFEVVPGVSSVTAGAAAAGIPLTHRGGAHGFLVITGSRSVDFDSPEWQAARTMLLNGRTVLIMMGLARLPAIVKRLMESGCSPELPAAALSRVTWPNEDLRHGVLGNIEEKAIGLKSPALIVLGTVAGMFPGEGPLSPEISL